MFAPGSNAAALDAADGVIDGKFNGRPIVQAGGASPLRYRTAAPMATYGASYGTYGGASSAALALDAADGVIDGKSFGRPIIQAGGPQIIRSAPVATYGASYGTYGGASSAALALDAADGVIDGKSFGRPIVQAGGVGGYYGGVSTIGSAYPQVIRSAPVSYGAVGGYSSTAAALDAADGVIDGKCFGRQIVQAGPQIIGGGSPVAYRTAAPMATYGSYGGASSAALALDAADGVIDGKSFGRPIIQAGGPQIIRSAPVATYGASYGTYGGASSAALALDAADGVIDGKSFGRPIIQAGGPQVIRTVQPGFAAGSSAAALDAADGVIDGKFHGRQIVQAGRAY